MTQKRLLIKGKTNTNFQKKWLNSGKIKLYFVFLSMIVFGSLYVLTGYTQIYVQTLLFSKSSEKFMPLLICVQFAGLISGVVLVGYLVKWFNMRWLQFGGFGLGAITLIVLCFLNKMGSDQSLLIIIYSLLTFMFGLGVGWIVPLASFYINAHFLGKDRIKFLGLINGFYGLGAGIIPLAAARLIISRQSNTQDFQTAIWFFVVAIILASIGAFTGLFLDYRHSKQLTSSQILDKKTASSQKKQNSSLWKPLIILMGAMFVYTIVETTCNFSYVQFADKAPLGKTGNWQINVLQAFGIYLIIQGLWRTISGFYIVPKIGSVAYVLMSCGLLLVALGLIFGGYFDTTWGVYTIAILFGLGVGNIYPVIFSYIVSLDERRATFLSNYATIAQFGGIFFGQLIISSLWLYSQNQHFNSFKFLLPLIFTAIFVVIIALIITISRPYIRKYQKAEINF